MGKIIYPVRSKACITCKHFKEKCMNKNVTGTENWGITEYRVHTCPAFSWGDGRLMQEYERAMGKTK